MNLRGTKRGAALAVGTLLCTATAAAAAAGVDIPIVHPANGDHAFAQEVAPMSDALPDSIGVLKASSNTPDRATISKLRDHLGADTGFPTMAVADFARARGHRIGSQGVHHPVGRGAVLDRPR